MNALRRITLASLTVLVGTGAAGARGSLELRVSPRYAIAPAAIHIKVTVDRADENRFAIVSASGPDYFRSSHIPLDGAQAARVHRLRDVDLPPGKYEIAGAARHQH